MGKYDKINFKPTEAMARSAKTGLQQVKDGHGGSGLQSATIARARDIAARRNRSPATVRRMKAFFDRHETNKSSESWKKDRNAPSRVAWNLWGGDAGQSWANARVRQMNAADGKNSMAHHDKKKKRGRMSVNVNVKVK